MYNVSNEYRAQMMERSLRRRVSGTIGTVPFTGADIRLESLNISNRCADETELKFGGVNIGQLNMTFVPSFLNKLSRKNYRGKVITLSIGLYIEENEAWEDVPCGKYIVSTVNISKEGIQVEALDYMSKLDKRFSGAQTIGTAYGILSLISSACGVELQQTEEEIRTFANGNTTMQLYAENDVETYRDLLHWLAVTTATFATINRSGKLELRRFGTNTTQATFDEYSRDVDAVFSDYDTHYTAISIVDIKSSELRIYRLPQIPNDGTTMNLGADPFIQYGNFRTKELMCLAIAAEAAQIEYNPFSMISARDVAFDLGDTIEFSGGLSGEAQACIMSIDYRITGCTFQGFGDDPRLATAKSKTDKNLAGIMAKTKDDKINFVKFVNAQEITVEDAETPIGLVRFAVKNKTDVETWAEIKAETDIPTDLILRYYLDDELVEEYHPENEWMSGFAQAYGTGTTAHIITTAAQQNKLKKTTNYNYHLSDIESETYHEWKITAEATTGKIVIPIAGEHILMWAQGLAGEDEWTGFLEAEDSIPMFYFQTLDIFGELDDDINITTIGTEEPITTEDGLNITTEDGLDILTE